MVNVTVRDVPDAARDRLAERASRGGQSLQQYLRASLIELAERPTVAEVLDQVRAEAHAQDAQVRMSADEIVHRLREDRDSHRKMTRAPGLRCEVIVPA